LKADTSISKSLPMKQMRAMANPTYREQILSLARWPWYIFYYL